LLAGQLSSPAIFEGTKMLVLQRKLHEGIQIGRDINIYIIQLSSRDVRIGIEAPDDVKILRHELVQNGKDGHADTK
jgi:carbon storage regulator